ncbi:M91 family zinc metallopeptidase [Pseudomonas fluorescens]|uniref:M91 family zinc metallopeptidase n=1 Tax=Pseudomonas fluorescens TaxID=294 RepID=UPI001BEC3BEA|nr:M91 family zinc metallopeptidase [Pseudomonas fluorescens]MBT2375109.1 hemolysin [Pseudomonas fluorescens]
MNIAPSPLQTPNTPAQTTSLQSTPSATPDNAATTKIIFSDNNTKNQHYSELTPDHEGKPFTSRSVVLIETTDKADTLNITLGINNKLTAYINGKSYTLPLTANGVDHGLEIRALGGNDKVSIDPRISITVKILGGGGNDLITAGGGNTQIEGGSGNDYIRLGSGVGVAHGGDGNDVILAGTGNSSLSGGKGNDQLYAMYPVSKTSLRQVYLNGDQGNDQLYAGTGRVILNGGTGDDLLIGHHQTTFYTGAGNDTVKSYSAQDKIYAKQTDTIANTANATTTYVKYIDSGKRGLNIEGTDNFIEQVEGYIEQLRGSPAGQRMLKELDNLADKTGAPVTIKLSEFEGVNSYNFRNAYRDKITDDEYEKHQHDSGLGYINNNTKGLVSTSAEISVHPDHFDEDFSISPLLALYHEMAHAYNGGTGTFIPGNRPITGHDGNPVLIDGQPLTVENAEYQAVGLPTDSPPFDFDNNPLTPPTTTNPHPFNENALRAEMGIPLRDRYLPEETPRIV